MNQVFNEHLWLSPKKQQVSTIASWAHSGTVQTCWVLPSKCLKSVVCPQLTLAGRENLQFTHMGHVLLGSTPNENLIFAPIEDMAGGEESLYVYFIFCSRAL